jgi:hypothetical protein
VGCHISSGSIGVQDLEDNSVDYILIHQEEEI